MSDPTRSNRIDVATPHVGEEEICAVADVLRSGRYASGPRVAEFERAFADYVGVGHAAAVANGTAALFIALECLGVGEGDEVIVPALTFFSTVTSVIYRRAKPVFADIDPDDLCISPDHVNALLTDRTRCILPVHLFGAVAKMNRINEVAASRGVAVLEDCAQAHGSAIDGERVGSLGHAGAFSFFATKHMTTGEGGMVTSNDADLVTKVRLLRSHGLEGRDHHVEIGYNNRMTEMAAAMGSIQLTKLDDLNRRRIANSEYLIDQLSDLDWAEFPVRRSDRLRHTYFWCPLLVKPGSGVAVDEVKALLDEADIGYRHRYTAPLYRQEALRKAGLDYSDVFLPNVERIAGQVIGLPNHPGLTRSELDRVVNVIRSCAPDCNYSERQKSA